MHYTLQESKQERRDRIKSMIITALSTLILLLLFYFYTYNSKVEPVTETVTTMLINFGDNKNGAQVEEPINQEGSLKSEPNLLENKTLTAPKVAPEKIITGKSENFKAPKTEKVSKKTINTPKSLPEKTTIKKPSSTKTKPSEISPKKTNGDAKGAAAIGNLIKGRGKTNGTQGVNVAEGNSGDPLGGDGNGDSKIGVDRKLIGFIPGTLGRGGSQPENNCTASGTIYIAYTVDKAGNVISAKRSSGIADACLVSKSVAWVKQYVKAEPANTNSTGSYKITF